MPREICRVGIVRKADSGGKGLVIGGCSRLAAAAWHGCVSTLKRQALVCRHGSAGRALAASGLYGVSFGLEHRAKRGIFSPNETKH